MIMLGYIIVSTMQEKVTILSMMQGNFSSFVSIL